MPMQCFLTCCNLNIKYVTTEWHSIAVTQYSCLSNRHPLNHVGAKVHFQYTILHYPVYDNEKGNWKILTKKEIYASVKKPTIIETIRLNRLRWFGHVQRMEESRIPKRVLYMNLGTTRLRSRPRNRWQDEVREDGRIVGGEGKKYVTERNGRSS